MVDIVCRRKNFALIYVININSLKDLGFCNMANPALCHNRNGHSLLYSFDHLRVAHSRNSTGCTYVSGNSFQSHYCTGTGSLCYFRLLGSCYIHNNATFQHLCKVAVQFLSIFCFFHNYTVCLFYLLLFSEFRRRNTFQLPKELGEMSLIGETKHIG